MNIRIRPRFSSLSAFFQQLVSVSRDSVLERIDLRILVMFLLIAGLFFAFARIASEVVEGDMRAFDHYIMLALRSHADPSIPIGPRWFNTAMLDITAVGGVAVISAVTVVVAGYLVVARKTALTLFVILAVSGGAILSTLLKSTFNRPRPDLVGRLVDVNSASFPSGHAMNSAVIYLTLGVLLANTRTEPAVRVYFLLVAICLTLTIGFSRVYLGVHWPNDVLAGWAIGASWALLCAVFVRQSTSGGK